MLAEITVPITLVGQVIYGHQLLCCFNPQGPSENSLL